MQSRVVVSATGIFKENVSSENNEKYFSSMWIFPQEIMGNILNPHQQKRQAKTRILGNVDDDKLLLQLKPGSPYSLTLAVGISQPNGKYPAQINFTVLEAKPAE